MDDLVIRAATEADTAALRRGVIELQEHERRLHPSRRPGEEMADAHLAWLREHAARDGTILVAERGGEFVGFVAGWVRQDNHIPEHAEWNRYGYVSDICVMPEHRGRRIAARLLDAIEERLAAAGVTRMLLFAIAGNTPARTVYEREGFVPYEVSYEKLLRGGRG
jgi:ribosomal protein S18 acetylase RimI-like enzyme